MLKNKHMVASATKRESMLLIFRFRRGMIGNWANSNTASEKGDITVH